LTQADGLGWDDDAPLALGLVLAWVEEARIFSEREDRKEEADSRWE